MKRLAISMVVFCSLIMMSVAAWCGDNGNGTVTINGLVWLKDAGCLGTSTWPAAMGGVAYRLEHGKCGLSDNSKAGDWRLPTIDEFKTVYSELSQFKNVQSLWYWSSTRSPMPHKACTWILTSQPGGSLYAGCAHDQENKYNIVAVRGGR